MKTTRLFYLAAAAAILITATSVLASERIGAEMTYSERTQQSRTESGGFSVNGSLVCQMPEQNTGAPCEIKLREQETGIVYSLRNSGAVRRLFEDGIREVAITGNRLGDTVLDVTRTQAR